MSQKSLKAFIRRSIKASDPSPDGEVLVDLLRQLDTAELQKFWFEFVTDRSFSATTSVPHWKTREQSIALKHEGLRWAFYPKEKDLNGRNIIVRSDLEEHIRSSLLLHIAEERRVRDEFKQRPFMDRFHVYLGMTVVVMAFAAVPVTIGVVIFTDSATYGGLARPAVVLFASLYALYLTLPLITRPIRWLCRPGKPTPK